ncbi:MAG: dethiobiotin synthase [Pirellulaceae bacterium]|nr:dethiobiotin synthase [Pirellulaceae bacterium]
MKSILSMIPPVKPPPGLFFVGTDTDVGKTYWASRLVRELRLGAVRVGVYKAVASGTGQSNVAGDAEQLCEAADLNPDLIDRVCPQRFAAPLAPPIAAAIEGRTVDEEALVSGATWWAGHCDLLVVEGAGGVLSPISASKTVLDLAEQLRLPLILVVASRVGCVNHTLLTVEAIGRRDLSLSAIVFNRISDRPSQPLANSLASANDQLWLDDIHSGNLQMLRTFLPEVPLIETSEDLLKLALTQMSNARSENLNS